MDEETRYYQQLCKEYLAREEERKYEEQAYEELMREEAWEAGFQDAWNDEPNHFPQDNHYTAGYIEGSVAWEKLDNGRTSNHRTETTQ